MGWSGSVAGGATLAAGAILMLFGDRPGNLVVAGLLSIAAAGWLLKGMAAARIEEEPGAIKGGENGWDSIKLGLSFLYRCESGVATGGMDTEYLAVCRGLCPTGYCAPRRTPRP